MTNSTTPKTALWDLVKKQQQEQKHLCCVYCNASEYKPSHTDEIMPAVMCGRTVFISSKNCIGLSCNCFSCGEMYYLCNINDSLVPINRRDINDFDVLSVK